MARHQRRSSGIRRVTRRWGRKKLVARLLDDSGEGQLKLMQWASSASSNEVRDLLLGVLRQYPAHDALPSNFLYTVAFLLAVVLLVVSLRYMHGLEFLFLPLLPYILVTLLIRYEARRPRIAREAALMLARVNDERAISYLVETWRENPTAKRENEAITDEITRLAIQACRPDNTLDGASVVRDFIRRQFPLASARDLTEAETDMFLAVLRLLGQGSDPENQRIVEMVSQLESDRGNHALVIELARQMVEPEAAQPTPHRATLPLITTAPPAEQVQQNRHF